jgi:hypothetical protein
MRNQIIDPIFLPTFSVLSHATYVIDWSVSSTTKSNIYRDIDIYNVTHVLQILSLIWNQQGLFTFSVVIQVGMKHDKRNNHEGL